LGGRPSLRHPSPFLPADEVGNTGKEGGRGDGCTADNILSPASLKPKAVSVIPKAASLKPKAVSVIPKAADNILSPDSLKISCTDTI